MVVVLCGLVLGWFWLRSSGVGREVADLSVVNVYFEESKIQFQIVCLPRKGVNRRQL